MLTRHEAKKGLHMVNKVWLVVNLVVIAKKTNIRLSLASSNKLSFSPQVSIECSPCIVTC